MRAFMLPLTDRNTYEPLTQDPGNGYSKEVADCLKQLECDNSIDKIS